VYVPAPPALYLVSKSAPSGKPPVLKEVFALPKVTLVSPVQLLKAEIPMLVRLEFFTVYFMILALMAYTDKLCNLRYSIVTKVYGVFCLILAVSQLFFSRAYGSETLIVW